MAVARAGGVQHFVAHPSEDHAADLHADLDLPLSRRCLPEGAVVCNKG